MTNLSINCEEVEQALQMLDAEINASEIHGTLSAMLCADSASTGDNWFQPLLPDFNSSDLLQKEAAHILGRLRDETRQLLNDPECEYQLLLPEDNAGVTSRTTALSDWCQGFIMGLMMCGLKDIHKMPENSAEVTSDIMEISRASSGYEMTDSEEDESALEELIEYVRVGVLLINEELNPQTTPPSSSTHYNNLH